MAETNIPIDQLSLPVGADPKTDWVSGFDELGNKVYTSPFGAKYTLRTHYSNDDRTAAQRNRDVVYDIGSKVADYLRDPSLPSVEQVKDFAVDSAKAVYEPIDRLVKGQGTYGDLISSTANLAGLGSAIPVEAGAIRMLGGPAKKVANSPEFKDWFKASVAKTGDKPDIYYTGTSKDKDFTGFNVGKHGAWFTKKPDEASMYALENDSMGYKMNGWNYEKTNTASRVIPAYIRAENPYRGELPENVLGQSNYKAAQSKWFEQLRKEGYDSWMPDSAKGDLLVVLQEPQQIKSIFNQGTFSNSSKHMNKAEGGLISFAEGGQVTNKMEQQMNKLFAEGGINTTEQQVDPVSGNEVPPGSLPSEVRDDVEAKLSGGEYVVPADVLRYYGVAFFEKLRAKAKEGLSQMDSEGRIGGASADGAGSDTSVDDFPFSAEELQAQDEPQAFAEGGVATATEQQLLNAQPTFNPADWSFGLAPTVGIPKTETKTYVNAAGNQISVVFTNGQPTSPIPEGYYLQGSKEAMALNSAKGTGEEIKKTGDSWADRQRQGDNSVVSTSVAGKGGTAGNDNWAKGLEWGNEEAMMSWANDNLKNDKFQGGAAQLAGVAVGGPAGALLGGVGKGLVVGKSISDIRAAAIIERQNGNVDLADKLDNLANARVDEMKAGSKYIMDTFATGQKKAASYLENNPPGTTSATASTSTNRTPTTTTPRTTTGSDKGYTAHTTGSTYKSGTTTAAQPTGTVSTPAGTKSVNTATTGTTGGYSYTPKTTSELRADAAQGRAKAAADKLGTGLATGGRAKGGLIEKKTPKAPRRKMKI